MHQTTTPPTSTTTRHRVVIIGSGFGGLFAARSLKRADVDITLIARTTSHLFQPLLYQVATGILSEGEIAPATREILRNQPNVTTILGDVTDIDIAARTVTSDSLGRTAVTPYDTLILAAGAGQSYFGNDQFARYAPGMKDIDDALELRGLILGSFEQAELAAIRGDKQEAARLMSFVVVGAGPTGVEMAGQIAELSKRTLKRDFRHIDPTMAQITLARRRAPGAARVRRPARARSPSGAWRRWASTCSSAPRSSTSTRPASRSRTSTTRPATSGGSRRSPRCGRPACRPARSAARSPGRPASRPTAPVGSRSTPTSRCPGTRRCSSSAT